MRPVPVRKNKVADLCNLAGFLMYFVFVTFAARAGYIHARGVAAKEDRATGAGQSVVVVRPPLNIGISPFLLVRYFTSIAFVLLYSMSSSCVLPMNTVRCVLFMADALGPSVISFSLSLSVSFFLQMISSQIGGFCTHLFLALIHVC